MSPHDPMTIFTAWVQAPCFTPTLQGASCSIAHKPTDDGPALGAWTGPKETIRKREQGNSGGLPPYVRVSYIYLIDYRSIYIHIPGRL